MRKQKSILLEIAPSPQGIEMDKLKIYWNAMGFQQIQRKGTWTGKIGVDLVQVCYLIQGPLSPTQKGTVRSHMLNQIHDLLSKYELFRNKNVSSSERFHRKDVCVHFSGDWHLPFLLFPSFSPYLHTDGQIASSKLIALAYVKCTFQKKYLCHMYTTKLTFIFLYVRILIVNQSS